MSKLFDATVPEFSSLAIDLWATLALAAEHTKHLDYIVVAAEAIVPQLLHNLHSEDDELVRSSMNCLTAIVSGGGPPTTPRIQEFIDTFLGSEHRRAALYAISANLSIGDFYPFLRERFDAIVEMADEDAALYVIGESIEKFDELLASPGHCVALLGVASRNVGQRSYELLFKMFKQLRSPGQRAFVGEHCEGIWSTFYGGVLDDLPKDLALLTAIFESLNAFILDLPPECFDFAKQILAFAITKIGSEVTEFMCGVVTTIATLLRGEVAPYCQAVMSRVLERNMSEEVLLVIDAFAVIMREDFVEYHEKLIKEVQDAFDSKNQQMIHAAALLVEHLFEYPTQDVLQYTSIFYNRLKDAVESPDWPREMKPILVNALVEVVTKVEDSFDDRFIDLFLLLSRMQGLQIDLAIPEERDFGLLLFEAVLNGYIVALQIPIIERKELVIRNVGQILRAVETVMECQLWSMRVFDLFVKMTAELVEVGEVEICHKAVANAAFRGLMAMIKESPHEELVAKCEHVAAEIEKRFARGF
jgi:hypothetical protein